MELSHWVGPPSWHYHCFYIKWFYKGYLLQPKCTDCKGHEETTKSRRNDYSCENKYFYSVDSLVTARTRWSVIVNEWWKGRSSRKQSFAMLHMLITGRMSRGNRSVMSFEDRDREVLPLHTVRSDLYILTVQFPVELLMNIRVRGLKNHLFCTWSIWSIRYYKWYNTCIYTLEMWLTWTYFKTN